MEIKNLTILGFSEATLTMVLDILETNNLFPKIKIINNLNTPPIKNYLRDTFDLNLTTNTNINERDLFILGVTKTKTKTSLLNLFNNINKENFLNLISKSSNISSTTIFGNGVIVNNMVCIAGHSVIGDFVFINRGVTIGHHTKIGDFTTINPGVNIAGNVKIGNNCQIGIGVNVFDNINIGDNVIIGGGSLVTEDIPNNVVVYGNPCKIIKENV
jgi:sugar O-acyltransferase (sialic acid O-acetyltransferase NeuD family)